ncbi:Uncharacterized protein related to plant photosystem II stability/assembly factor (plasmid) [Legionella adelaidensis]|uniref:Uncharacterized protein related to plant photosystem II stability/assembly factor n=1 Tax=Legionella adelaidensis TaxID=45056 RepID=A0A0W0R0J1_9GAMM|nr:type II secretion system protein [Legionella adelaidensis]KTC64612.1 hypothetical protein Lade_1906 [Legionella adelaidensis]VEH86079.1 Uncharacterized protein related to plant photosystem II stability/assembly factor [Legionella adelaidensis]
MKRQKGFLMIAALVIIVIFGVLSGLIVSLSMVSNVGTVYLDQLNSAAFLAESGLQQAKSNLTQAIIANRQSCAGLNSTLSLSTGNFSIARATNLPANNINPRYAYATLTMGFTAASSITTLSVNDTSVFSPLGGRVLIGDEVFSYMAITNSTTLSGVSRAMDGSRAVNHVASELVSQYQCVADSVGTSPVSTAFGSRQYQMGIQQPVAFTVGQDGVILRWNSDASELQWEAMSAGSFVYNAISALNYHSAWAVGNSNTSNIRLARLEGNTWSTVSIPISQPRNLNGVDAVSSIEAWAVGDLGQGNSFTIFRWTRDASNSSTNWCRLPCSGKTITTSGTTGQRRGLQAIKMYSTSGSGVASVGYAVGGQSGTGGNSNRGVVMSYNGTTWSNLPLPGASNEIGLLYGIDIVPNGSNNPKDIFIVGRSSQNNDGKILRYKDGVWSPVITTSHQLRSVSVLDTDGDGYANFIIAVGHNGQVVTLTANSSAMSVTSTATLTGVNLFGVNVASTTSAWAVGENGKRFHYNGSGWVQIEAGVNTEDNLNSVKIISAKENPVSFSWYELIN